MINPSVIRNLCPKSLDQDYFEFQRKYKEFFAETEPCTKAVVALFENFAQKINIAISELQNLECKITSFEQIQPLSQKVKMIHATFNKFHPIYKKVFSTKDSTFWILNTKTFLKRKSQEVSALSLSMTLMKCFGVIPSKDQPWKLNDRNYISLLFAQTTLKKYSLLYNEVGSGFDRLLAATRSSSMASKSSSSDCLYNCCCVCYLLMFFAMGYVVFFLPRGHQNDLGFRDY